MKQSWLQLATHGQTRFRNLDPAGAGLVFGILATLCYTLVGVILRDLADDTDPYWVSCIKAIPTLLAALWLMYLRRKRKQPVVFPLRLLPILFLVGVIVQIGGNAGLQWAFEIIGLAISIPLMFGTLIVGSAVIGVLMFNERLTQRRLLAVVLLMAAVCVLSFAAREEVEETEALAATVSLAAMGVLVACLSGIAYAISHAAIRKCTSPQIPLCVPLAIFSIAGILVLGGISYWRLGWEGISGTTADQWWRLTAAGIINAVAYFSLGRAIQTLPLVQVNLITASQVALNAVAGIMIFAEPVSAALIIGVLLTMAGLVVEGRRRKAAPAKSSEPEPAVE